MQESQTVTLEMLINGTSGYPDYMPMDVFQDKFYSNSFYQLTTILTPESPAE